MKFKNPAYQKLHDKMAVDFKRITGKDLDESFEAWKQAGMPKYEPSEKFKQDFEEWKRKEAEDPHREEREIRELAALRAIEERKKKKTQPKSKRMKRCKCK